MDFFVHSRAAPNAGEPEPALTEEHWSYMDRFAAGMIARGPTLAADRATWTGSVHIVNLPGAEAARDFVEREPYNRAGMYEQHVIWRFDNLLGRTMREFPGECDDPIFMVIAQVHAVAGEHAVPPIDPPALPPERLIVHGELRTPAEGRPVGVVFALHAPTPQAAAALLERGPSHLGEQLDVLVRDWEIGGRR